MYPQITRLVDFPSSINFLKEAVCCDMIRVNSFNSRNESAGSFTGVHKIHNQWPDTPQVILKTFELGVGNGPLIILLSWGQAGRRLGTVQMSYILAYGQIVTPISAISQITRHRSPNDKPYLSQSLRDWDECSYDEKIWSSGRPEHSV